MNERPLWSRMVRERGTILLIAFFAAFFVWVLFLAPPKTGNKTNWPEGEQWDCAATGSPRGQLCLKRAAPEQTPAR